jgi:hypothetical protein
MMSSSWWNVCGICLLNVNEFVGNFACLRLTYANVFVIVALINNYIIVNLFIVYILYTQNKTQVPTKLYPNTILFKKMFMLCLLTKTAQYSEIGVKKKYVLHVLQIIYRLFCFPNKIFYSFTLKCT